MPEPKWRILTALSAEADAVQHALKSFPRAAVEIIVVGIRGSRLSNEMFQQPTKGILLAGLSGAIDPALTIGQVIVSPVVGEWPRLPFQSGRLHTAANLVGSPAEKAELFRASQAAAVDMETDIVAEYARRAGVRLLSLRCISDTAADSISPQLIRWVDDTGRPRAGALALGLATHPSLIPSMIRLWKTSRRSLFLLGRAVRQILPMLDSAESKK